MKKLALAACLLTLNYISATAQKEDKPTVVALQAGVSLAASVTVDTINVFHNSDYQPSSVSRTSTPVFIASIDQKAGRRLSVGGALSYQKFNLVAFQPNNQAIEAESGNVNRIHLSGRMMWHFGKNEKVDLYTGFKLGYFMQTVSNHTQASASFNSIPKLEMSSVTAGLIPLGLRWFITDQFGINFESSLGRASVFQIGANYRWGKSAAK